ncbi:MAG: hypothetical protein OEL83_08180 [Desulforhopalus sp.]|nr:hypothetical protein [Desulforhopalus sp.]
MAIQTLFAGFGHRIGSLATLAVEGNARRIPELLSTKQDAVHIY